MQVGAARAAALGRLCALVILFLAAFPGPLAAETRVALVIGNGAYRHAPTLANPANDARAVAATLRRLDFTVEAGLDLDIAGTRAALRRFTDALQDADVGLFFYAGHGLQVRGQNYLVPVDAALNRETDLIFEAVDFDDVLRLLQDRPRTSLVFLDACRDNPLARSLARNLGQARSQVVGQGLAEVESGIGTLIAYATEPGNVASDGQGDHSPFTAALLANLETPGLEVGQMLRRVRKTVIDRTAHQQVPWDHSSLTGDFYFKPPAPTVTAPTPPTDRDMAVWKAIETSTEPEDFSTFIAQYPDSPLVPFARTRIATLRTRTPGETTSRPTPPPSASGELKPAIGTEAAPTSKPEEAPAAASSSGPPVQTAASHSEPNSKALTVGSPESAELALGLTQDDWRATQRALNALDHPAGPEDGLPGRQTRSAVAAWQQASGAKPSGYLTVEQRARLLSQAKPQLAALVPTKPPSPQNAPIHDCDRLAGSPSDAGHVGPGVEFEKLDAERAIAACSDAVSTYPAELRFQYQYGRALLKAGRDVDALLWLRGRVLSFDDTRALARYREGAEQRDAIGRDLSKTSLKP
jgi:peptidoglycan hydrolase-like protein with peptidoglycan-binding domain